MRRRCVALLVTFAVLAACSDGDGSAAPSPAPTTSSTTTTTTSPPHPLDDELRLDQVQALGTHNSYHVEPAAELAEVLAGFDQALADSLAYTHRPITEQLDQLGVRQLELDVFADPDGGRWTTRALFDALSIEGPPVDPAMDGTGLKVFHVQDIDMTSTCPTFTSCLEEIRDWSLANPGHVPILVLVEAKDAEIPDPLGVFTQPLPFDAVALDLLDAEVRSVFDEEHVLTPDDVRGDADTLEAAVLEGGWPTLGEVRGKVLLALDNTDAKRDLYTAGHPSLEGRMLFTSAEPGQPEAAFLKLNDPIADGPAITQAVRDGYLVRTRADGDTAQARTGDRTTADAALASGAQYVSTDYPEPDPDLTDYVVAIPDGMPARCNPVSGSAACRPTDVEAPEAPGGP